VHTGLLGDSDRYGFMESREVVEEMSVSFTRMDPYSCRGVSTLFP
jgi:hypothetical protein